MKLKNKKYLFLLVLVLMFFINSISAQNSPEGKTYQLLTNSVCKKMEDGGCTLDYYQVMTFTNKQVTIYKLIKASCTPKEREDSYNYKPEPLKYIRYWNIKDNKIFIEKYDEYGKMELKDDKIIAKKGSTVKEFLEKKE